MGDTSYDAEACWALYIPSCMTFRGLLRHQLIMPCRSQKQTVLLSKSVNPARQRCIELADRSIEISESIVVSPTR